MSRSKHSEKNESFDTESGGTAIYIDDRVLEEEELLHLLDQEFAPSRQNSAMEDFSWDAYLEGSWSGRRY